MYIGPWQEYNLSRFNAHANKQQQQQQQYSNDNRLNTALKNDLEDAIMRSLDPAAARKVLASVRPLLNSVANNSSSNSINSNSNNYNNDRNATRLQDIPSSRVNGTYNIRKEQHRSIKNGESNQSYSNGYTSSMRKKNQVKPLQLNSNNINRMNSINNQLLGNNGRKIFQNGNNGISQFPQLYRISDDGKVGSNSNNTASTPLSVRSSISEPIQGTKLLNSKVTPSSYPVPPPDQYINANNGVSSTQPPYNTTGAISLLRLHRSNKVKAGIAQFWDWNTAAKSDTSISKKNPLNCNSNSNTNSGSDVDEKIKKVKDMQSMYINNMQSTNSDKPVANSSASNEMKLNTSPIRVRSVAAPPSPIRSPKITDMDITDMELVMISKYFASHPKTLVDGVDDSRVGAGAVEMSDDYVDEETSNAITDSAADVASAAIIASTSTTDADAYNGGEDDDNVGGVYDELYCGSGVDGLLSWTSQLDIDNL